MRLLDEWKEWAVQEGACPVPSQGYLLNHDRAILGKLSDNQSAIVRDSWTDVVDAPDFGAEDRTAFHLGLLPQPFMGDLKNAEIYVLTLNPGYSPTDYFGEYCVPEFREALLRNLRQEHTSPAKRNLHLDPQYAWSGGYGYWHTRLSGIILEFAKTRGWSYAKARSKLGEKLTIIELIPYHSLSGVYIQLPSTKLAMDFVKSHVLKRVRCDKAIVIGLRQADRENPCQLWSQVLRDLGECDGVYRYTSGQARGASFSLNAKAPGGRAILDWAIERWNPRET